MKIFARISWFFATLILLIALTFMIATFYIIPRPYNRKISSWIIRLTTFFSTQKVGNEDPEAQMFLLNHQSDLDIVVLETSTARDITWVAKKELFEVPFFGLAMRLPKDIAVERESKMAMVKLLKDAKEVVKTGRVIAMFPEGTRSASGKMLPFKAGAKVVADALALKVQPIVLMQTAKHYSMKNFTYIPGKIKMIFLDSFVADKTDPNWLDEVRAKMQRVYDDELSNSSSNR